MNFLRKCALFFLGGTGYVSLELLWRGWSHGSMFLAGGICFLLLGRVAELGKASWIQRGLLGAGIITSVELAAGLVFNRAFQVWDYRNVPGNFLGQICLPFTVLWIPISLGAMVLYKAVQPRN